MTEEITNQLQATKKASYSLRFIDEEKQNNLLLDLANRLRHSINEIRAIVKCCVWDKLFIKRRPVLIAH